jgi:sortase A
LLYAWFGNDYGEKKIGLKKSSRIKVIGTLLILLSATVAVLVYGPLYWKRYQYDKNNPVPISVSSKKTDRIVLQPVGESVAAKETQPVSPQFGLVIPKINVNVPVVKNVDGTIPKEYFEKLKNGVGHYKGTPLPDKNGNTVIFGHSSSVPGVKSTQYSETFLLLDKLSPGDKIELYYGGAKQTYAVREVKEIRAEDLSPLDNSDDKRLTLFTCWPPGTSLKRLVAVALLVN